MDTLKKYKRLLVYVFGFHVVIYLLLAFQNQISMTFNILFLSLHLFITYYAILKIKKREVNKDKDYMERIELREQELQALFDNNNSYLWSIDLEKKTFLPSIGFENILGYPREAFMSNYELWLQRVIEKDMPIAREHYDKLKSGQASNAAWRFKDSRGEIKWLDAWGKPIFSNGKVARITGVAYDITERKALEAELKYNATHDHLTGLPNRTMLGEYIEKELKEKDITSIFSILFLDLDSFKSVNDNYGHIIGDQVLIEAARRIKSTVGEKGLVTRHGGDEFVIIVPYTDYEKLVALAMKIMYLFESPFQVDGEQKISVSIGISIYPKDGKTLPALINRADRALYDAKLKGKNNYQFADQTLNETEMRKEKIENELLTVLNKNQLEVFYQPKVVLETEEIYGVEALIRWNHPEFGMIPPDEFIPIAESKGMIHDIGLWVLDEVMKQSKEWEDKGIDLSFAINVSNVQFESPRFVDKIEQLLLENEMNPEKLIIEITETFMHTATSSQSIKRLKDLGLEVSIDDFGTGYSSLSTLKAQHVDEIKIDKSFIRNMKEGNANPQIVKTILSLSEAFLSRTVAEGIETEEEAALLQKMGCLYGQGYLYSPPVKSERIEEHFLNG